jgi:hypothetical protein
MRWTAAPTKHERECVRVALALVAEHNPILLDGSFKKPGLRTKAVARLLLAATALVSAFFLVIDASVARADPSFALTQSAAAAGDSVHFAISGAESRASYVLEVEGESVAEGTVPAGSTISGAFTMPDLGNTSRAVTVEAEIALSDETVTRARSLQYVVTSQANAGPTEAQPVATPTSPPDSTGREATQVLTQSPAGPSEPASGPARRSQPDLRPASPPAPGRRHARRAPHPAPERRTHRRAASRRQHNARPGYGGRGRPRAVSASRARTGPSSAMVALTAEAGPEASVAPEHGGRSARPESGELDAATGLPSFLTATPAPAIFLLATGVAGDADGSSPVAAAIALPLLGLTALTFARGGVAIRRRSARGDGGEVLDGSDDDRDDDTLRGFIYVPDDDEIDAIGAHLEAAHQLDDRLEADYDRTDPNGGSHFGLLLRGTELVQEEQEAETTLAEAIDIPLQEAATSFEPISLADLDRRAKLATRTDRKYVLDARIFDRLVGELISRYLILEIDGVRVFPYDTVYFDTPAWTAYRQHVQGRRRRFKTRTRLYVANELCYFEVKLRGARGKTVKRKLELGVEEHGSLTEPAFAFLERVLQKAYGTAPPAALAPVLRTTYRRLTLVGRTDSERLTFDFELVFAANGNEYSIRPGRILLETKADAGRLGTADRVLQGLGARPVRSCSKYCLGVALANPELRDNPFRRLIRRHFEAGRPR